MTTKMEMKRQFVDCVKQSPFSNRLKRGRNAKNEIYEKLKRERARERERENCHKEETQ